MNARKLLQNVSLPAVFALGLTTGLVAQPTGDIPQRTEQKRADLSGAPGMEVIASIVEIKPGESTELHTHHGIETAYLIQGGEVATPSNPRVSLPTGATLMGSRGVKHGAFKNIGDAPLRFFVVHVVDKGRPLYDFSN